MDPELQTHWDAAYAGGDTALSWFQDDAAPSVAAIRALGLDPDAPVVDVGGGSSSLARRLLDEGHRDVTVLDLSPVALAIARERLGDRAGQVTWVVADVRDWRPERRFAIWHDRAVLHFLTEQADRDRYARTLRAAVAPGGHVIIATFAPDGPERCSGLPVWRAAPEEVLGVLGADFAAVSATRELHRTPSGNEQAFSRVVARRAG